MFIGRCFKDGCKSKIYGKCECKEGIILFCKNHGIEHFRKETSKGHRMERIYVKEIRQLIINKLKELRNDIKSYRVETIMSATQFIKNFKTAFGNYIDQINEKEIMINKMIKILDSDTNILDAAVDSDIESVLKLNVSDSERKISEWGIQNWYLDYEYINSAIKKTYETSFNPFRENLDNTPKGNELSFFRHATSNFATINLDTFQISSTVTLPTQEPIHGYMTSCIIPDYNYFYCCNDSSSGLTFIIDKDKNVKLLQKSKSNMYATPIFYYDSIYLIGGSNNLAERYDLKQNVWESMAPLPQGLNFSSGCNALYKDSILLTSYYIQKVIIYSITQNNYQEEPNLILQSNYHKFMLNGNNRIYLFEKGGRIFESAENNILSWMLIGNNRIPEKLNQSSTVHYKGCLYFVVYPNQLWKFDLSSKEASQVATV